MTSAIPKSNSKSQYLGLTLYQYLVNKWLIGNDPIQFPIQYMVSTIYMTSDISQSNSKSQYLRVPLYQYLQIKQHIGNDPIQFPIQYMDTPLSTSLNICMTSDIPKSNFKSQYLGLPSYQWIQLTNRNHCPRVPLHESKRLKYPKIITGHTLSYVKLNLK